MAANQGNLYGAGQKRCLGIVRWTDVRYFARVELVSRPYRTNVPRQFEAALEKPETHLCWPSNGAIAYRRNDLSRGKDARVFGIGRNICQHRNKCRNQWRYAKRKLQTHTETAKAAVSSIGRIATCNRMGFGKCAGGLSACGSRFWVE